MRGGGWHVLYPLPWPSGPAASASPVPHLAGPWSLRRKQKCPDRLPLPGNALRRRRTSCRERSLWPQQLQKEAGPLTVRSPSCSNPVRRRKVIHAWPAFGVKSSVAALGNHLIRGNGYTPPDPSGRTTYFSMHEIGADGTERSDKGDAAAANKVRFTFSPEHSITIRRK